MRGRDSYAVQWRKRMCGTGMRRDSHTVRVTVWGDTRLGGAYARHSELWAATSIAGRKGQPRLLGVKDSGGEIGDQ